MPAGASAARTAPGGPGAEATWAEADKDGYGTSTRRSSKVWHTLDDGRLTEVFYPDLGTPSVRALDFVVSDGRTFAQRDSDAANRRIELLDSRSLTYRQVNVEPGRFRVTKTYVTDPARHVLLVNVRFRSLTGKRLQLHALYDPSLGNDAMDDSGTSSRRAVLATDAGSPVASALIGSPSFVQTSNGYFGTPSDGWEDLKDFRMHARYGSAPNGNVVQTARTRLTGVGDSTRLTLALGFGGSTRTALTGARASLSGGFGSARSDYEAGWQRYLAGLKGVPSSAAGRRTLYSVSVMTLAAHEDKTHLGGYIASPSMPWIWGSSKIENPSGAYHLVWSRDLYQIGTALLAAGDRAGANRAVDYLFLKQQKADGSFPQNSTVDGKEHWTNLQLDEVALPIVLAWQLGRTDRRPLPGPHQEGRGLHRQLPGRALLASGALGEPERVLARHDRGRDRRPRVRRRHRAQERRRRLGRPLRADGGRLAAARGGLDGHDDRALLAAAVLPPPHEGRESQRGHGLQHRRQRADGRPAQGRRSELSRAGPARRQAGERPDRSSTP